MTTLEQDAPSVDAELGEAVEAQMGMIVTELGAALGVLLISLGTRSGLWAALAGAGRLTVDQVADKVSVDRALVRDWLSAQAAGGYVDYDPAGQTFTLPEAVAAAIYYGPGGALVDACATMLSSMGEGFTVFSAAFASGRVFGWHERTADHWHGTDVFTRIAVPAELIEATIGEMTGVAAALAAGGTVLHVGCGYGAPTMAVRMVLTSMSTPWSGTTSPVPGPTRCSTTRQRRGSKRDWPPSPRKYRTPRNSATPRGSRSLTAKGTR